MSARSSVVNGSLRGAKERRSFKPKVAGSTPVGRIHFPVVPVLDLKRGICPLSQKPVSARSQAQDNFVQTLGVEVAAYGLIVSCSS